MPKIPEHWSPGCYQSDRERDARHKQLDKTYPQPSWEDCVAAMPTVSAPAPKPKPHPDHTPSGAWDK
mgnify:CR=1 FL=1